MSFNKYFRDIQINATWKVRGIKWLICVVLFHWPTDDSYFWNKSLRIDYWMLQNLILISFGFLVIQSPHNSNLLGTAIFIHGLLLG